MVRHVPSLLGASSPGEAEDSYSSLETSVSGPASGGGASVGQTVIKVKRFNDG